MTSLAFKRSMEPSGLYFVRQIHLQPTRFLAWKEGTKDHVQFRSNASNSSCMVLRQEGCFSAWEMEEGSEGYSEEAV